MTDLVVGGGAVGSLLAWALARGGRDAAIVRRSHDGPPAPGSVTVVEADGRPVAAQVTEVGAPGDLAAPPEVIVFAVKQFDLAAAVESCAGWPAVPSLTVANGVGAEELVAATRPGAGVIAGSVTVSVEREADGRVRRLNRGGLGLALFEGDVGRLSYELGGAAERAGLRVRHLADARSMKWSKLVANLVGNATSAIVDLSPAEIYASVDGFSVERRQLLEALAVLRRLGLTPVALPGADVRLLALAARLPSPVSRPVLQRVVGGARGGKDPSLRLHARSGSGPSEVAWLNGAVAAEARRLGGRAPVNERLAELVEEVLRDAERRAWFRSRPDRLARAVLG